MKRTSTNIKVLRTASTIFALLFMVSAAGCAKTAGSPSAAEPTAASQATSTAAPEISTAAKQPETTTAPDKTGTDPATVSPVNATGQAAAAETAAAVPTSENDLPSLTVTYQDGTAVAEIPSAAGGYTLNVPQPDGTVLSAIACGSDPLTDLAQSGTEIPYVEFGGQMILSFEGGPQPDTVKLTDLILRRDGTAQYGERTFVHTDLECKDGKAEFTLEQNPAVYLSSTLNPEGFYRGFRVNCTWANGTEAEYAFILRAGTCFPIESSPDS